VTCCVGLPFFLSQSSIVLIFAFDPMQAGIVKKDLIKIHGF
jgi:hypothetical protein